jgi:putative transposase
MPRIARIKNSAGIYHIMVRSISDIPLFRNSQDKDQYLKLIKKYLIIFRFKVYAYCLMTTHAHIIIDCSGADISKIMKSINQSYAAYFNKKYNRHGHLFQDRFHSKIIDNEKYLINLSVYIHNNPKDIEKYKDNVEKYKYSSLGIYLDLSSDKLEILDTNFILQHFSDDKASAEKSYHELIKRFSNTSKEIDVEFKKVGTECRSERKILIRNFTPEEIINFIQEYTDSHFNIHIKFNHKVTIAKSLCVLIMRSLCNFTFKQICSIIGNITESSIWRLCDKGYSLITTDDGYKNLLDNIIERYSAA